MDPTLSLLLGSVPLLPQGLQMLGWTYLTLCILHCIFGHVQVPYCGYLRDDGRGAREGGLGPWLEAYSMSSCCCPSGRPSRAASRTLL